MAKVISFATQKGGAGKSTLALVLAAPLAIEYGLRVAVVDCDYQQSIVKTRAQVDAANFAELLLQEPAARYPYDVFALGLGQVFSFLDEKAAAYDLVILDLPGRADSDEVFQVLTACDAVLVPVVADYLDRSSTAEFMNLLEIIQAAADAHGLDFQYFGVVTKRVAGRRENRQLEAYLDDLGLVRFTAFLSLRVAYSRASTLYSLLNPAWLRYAGGNRETAAEIRSLCDELMARLPLSLPSPGR